MTLRLVDDSAFLCISVFEPRPSSSTDDLVSRLSSISTFLCRTLFVTSAVFRSLSNSPSARVAVFSVWKKESAAAYVPHNNHPGESLPRFHEDVYVKSVLGIANAIDVNWYKIYCWDCKDGISGPQLAQGDIVHLRGIVGETDNDELLSYSCLAILKAYFQGVEGLLSCAFYKSLHEPKMTGLGVWKDVAEVYKFFSSPGGTPGDRYWTSLGAKLRFGIYEVVNVTAAT